MMYDIPALQYIYGANFAINGTNSVYTWSPTTGEMSINGVGQGAPGDNLIFMTIWDGGGTDTYDLSNYSTSLTVNLSPGDWSVRRLARQSRRGPYAAAISPTRCSTMATPPR